MDVIFLNVNLLFNLLGRIGSVRVHQSGQKLKHGAKPHITSPMSTNYNWRAPW